MALILNIDTAIVTASVCLSNDAGVLAIAANESQKDHAAWLHVAIKELIEKNQLELESVDAVAITGGPGSYTGLRIGMATAKGICYALNKPLVILNTLEVMANSAGNALNSFADKREILLCPMIDARRMEVFTAIYTKDLHVVKEPSAMTLNENSFDEELAVNNICFFGNGSVKFQSLKNSPAAFFIDVKMDASSMATLSANKFEQKEFANLAYAEPMYLKEFYSPAR